MNNDYSTRIKTTALRRHATVVVGNSTASFDAANYRTALIVMNADLSGGGKSFTFSIEESDDNSSWALSGLSATKSGSDALTVVAVLLDATKRKRFMRIKMDAVGGAPTPSVMAVCFNEAVTPDAAANIDVAVV